MEKYLYIIMIGCFLASTSCQKDNVQLDLPEASSQQVELRLNLPAQQDAEPATYAFTANDENKISTVDVLAFKVVNGRELYAYRTPGTLIDSKGASSQVKFYANLLKGSDNYRFVVLCNVREELNNNTSSLVVNKLKSELLSALITIKSTKWNGVSSASFNGFPLWGETDLINGIQATTSSLALNMIRSVAAIDVTLSGNAVNDFLITSVSLYKSNDRGLIAPISSNYNSSSKSVSAPSITDANQLPIQLYNLNSPSTSYKREIYLFESRAATQMNNIFSTGLVIGGRYKGSNVDTYYRVEIINSSGTLIPLLRNYRYTINITSVRGAGFSDSETAWNSKIENITATIVPWNLAKLAPVVIPGAHELKVSKSTFQLNGGASSASFTISTNYPEGWKLKSNDWWIYPSLSEGKVGQNTVVSFRFEANLTGNTRSGTLTITSGKIIKTIKLTQTRITS